MTNHEKGSKEFKLNIKNTEEYTIKLLEKNIERYVDDSLHEEINFFSLPETDIIPQIVEEIIMVICIDKKSKNPLYYYKHDKNFNPSSILKYIIDATHRFSETNGKEELETVILDQKKIHFFKTNNYYYAIITTKGIERESLTTLVLKLEVLSNQQLLQDPQLNRVMKTTLKKEIEKVKKSLVKKQYVMKIILGGDGAVGKTSIRKYFLEKKFKLDYNMTIGADFASKEVPYLFKNGIKLKYLIWDLAGQPRFNKVRPTYYNAALGALIVFDVTRPRTFRHVPRWLVEFWKHNGKGPMPVVILGNKTDLKDDSPEYISDQRIQKFVHRLSEISETYQGFKIYYLPTSAKTGLNIEKSFILLGREILDYFDNKNEKKNFEITINEDLNQ